jgi:hypothetical protein
VGAVLDLAATTGAPQNRPTSNGSTRNSTPAMVYVSYWLVNCLIARWHASL